MLGRIFSVRNKTLSSKTLVESMHIKEEKASLPVPVRHSNCLCTKKIR